MLQRNCYLQNIMNTSSFINNFEVSKENVAIVSQI